MKPVAVATWAAAAAAVAGAVHCAYNQRLLPHLRRGARPVAGRVSVLVPARDEAERIDALIGDLRAQRQVADLEVIVLDDDSHDDTATVARAAAGSDSRFAVHTSHEAVPPGWLGKPWACARLARLATGQELVFVDADVRLHPDAVAAAVAHRRDTGAAVLSAWPRQEAHTPLALLIQPLQQWSWLTTLPLGVAARSHRPSLAAANGQFLVIDRAGYAALGGHSAVAGEVLEDIALARAARRAGLASGLADASAVAHCRMYDTDAALVAGYGKSAWAAFGGPARSVLATAALAGAAVLPPAYALVGRHGPTRIAGSVGYLAMVGNRLVAAAATGGGRAERRSAAAHPAALVAFAALTAHSARRHRRGTLAWRGRPVVATAGPGPRVG